MKNWYVVTPDGKEIMMPEDELLAGVSAGQYAAGTLIWREGLETWEPIEKHFPEAFRKLPPIPAAASAAACTEPARRPDVAKENRESGGRSCTGRPVPSYVWKAGLWFLVSLLCLLCALFGDMKGSLQIKFWLGFLGALGWGIHALDSGATKHNNNKKES